MAITGGGADPAPGDLAGLVVGTWPRWVPTFRLVHQLGDRGAEGTTYRAERLRRDGDAFVPSGEHVALKVFDRDAFWRDGDGGSRPLHERLDDLEDLAHLLSEVPGVVRFRSPFVGPDPLPLGVEPDPSSRLRTYLPMELVEGPTLQQVIDQTPDFEARLALLPRLGSLAQTLRCFVEARPDAPVSHRDVKPANLVLTGEDSVTLVDLGLLVSPRRSVTAGVGSFGFMAPEQQESKRLDPELAHRVDWFGFYATVASLLTGESPPFSVRGWSAWLTEHRAITPLARSVILAAATSAPKARPKPWEWLARLEDALGARRRIPFARALVLHRQATVAGATALAVGLVGVPVWLKGVRDHDGAGRTRQPLSVGTTWPLRPSCDTTSAVAMPAGLGPPDRRTADPRAGMLATGATAWRSGRLTVRITNNAAVPASLIDITPHRQGHSLGSPAWVYRVAPTSAACTTTPSRRYLLDMDEMDAFRAEGQTPRSETKLGRSLLVPARGSVDLEFDVSACLNNVEFTMTLSLVLQGTDAPLRLNTGRFILGGPAEGATLYTGADAGTTKIPPCRATT